MRRVPLAFAAALLGALLAAPAQAQGQAHPRRVAEGRVVMGLATAPSGLDPHAYAANTDASVHVNIYESLVRLSAEGQVQPALATAWRVEDGLAWDFTLREGVAFHDGTPFTAEDVAASFARAAGLKTSLRGLASKLQAITAVELHGPHALRLRTARPAPGLAEDLAKVPILRRSATLATEAEAFNSLREAIGTGPFRVTGYVPEAAVELVRHAGWWGGAVPWGSASLRFIPRDAVRTAALRAGDIDVMERVAAADAPMLAARGEFALAQAPGANAVYVIPQIGREEGGAFLAGPGGAKLAANPLRDRRVRQALSLAVARTALAERLLAGAGLPTGQLAPAVNAQHVAGIAAPLQDLAAARALLAEAGVAEGFRLSLHGPSDRFAGITQVAEALAQMWSRIGVATTVETMPWNTLARRAGRGEFAALLFACCSSTLDMLAVTRDLLATHDPARSLGVSNYGRHADARLDGILMQGLSSFDPAVQARARQEAAQLVAEEVPLILLYHPVNIWAARAPLAYTARLDGQSPILGARPNAGP
jgi:peptide/nickel transport system substrate-binding protein